MPRALARATTSSRRPGRCASGGEPWIFYEGPPTANGRPASTTCGPGCSRTSSPASRPCGAATCPARAAGTATACRSSSRSRRSWASAPRPRSRPTASTAFNQRCRESVHRYVEDWSSLTEPGRRLDRHRRRLLDPDQRLHRVGVVADAPAVGRGPALRGPPGHALLRPLRHRPVEPRGGPGLPRTSSTRRSTCASRSPATAPADADLLVWTTTPWTLISNVAAAVGPTSPTSGSPTRPAAATWCWPSGGRAPLPGGRGRGRAGPGPAWRAGATERPFDFLGRSAGKRRRRVVAADFVSRPTTAPASSTSPPRSARTTPQVGRAEDLPVLNPVDADGHLRPPRRPRGRAASSRTPTPASSPTSRRGACSCASSPTSTATPTAGGAARRSSTGPRRRGSCARPSAGPTCWRRTRRINWYPDHIKHGRFGELARGQRRLGPVPRPLLGHAAADLALRRLRPRHVRRLGGRAVGAGRARPVRPRPAPALRRRRDLDAARRRVRGHACGAWPPCSTPGSTRGRCRRPSTTTRSATAGGSRRRSRPTSSARPSTRPAAGSTRCWRSTRWCSARRRTATWCASACSSTRTARRCRSPGATWSTRGTSVRRFGADALRWYFFSSGQPWGDAAGRRGRHPRVDPPDAAHAVERVHASSCTYADLDGWQPDPAGERPQPTHVLDRWVLGELDATVAEVTEALEDFDALAGPSARRPLRRRPVQLVRAPHPAPVLEGQRPGGPRHAAPLPGDHGAAAGPVLPVPGRRAVRGAHRRVVGPPVRLAGTVGGARPGAGDPDGRRPPAGGARPGGPHRRQGQGAPAAAPGAGAAPGGHARPGRARPRSRTS